MSANKSSFTDGALESIVYWDASYAISCLVETEQYHDECVVFQKRLKAEGILSVSSDFVYDELSFFLIRQALTKEGRKTGQHWLDVKRLQPDFISRIMPDVKVKTNELNDITLWLSTGEQVKEKAFQLMSDYSLLPTDAFHIAAALEHGVNGFVTLDEDFLRVNSIIVYTCLSAT
jgi:predicted nucleic acid-binding protein